MYTAIIRLFPEDPEIDDFLVLFKSNNLKETYKKAYGMVRKAKKCYSVEVWKKRFIFSLVKYEYPEVMLYRGDTHINIIREKIDILD